MRRSLLIWCLLLAGIICIAQSGHVSAFWQSRGSGYNKSIASGPSCIFPTLSGLVAHWRADTGVTTSGGNITQVLDQSGGGNTLTPVVGNVPFTASSAYNSHPAFGFAAANQAALVATSFPLGVGSNGSVFVVGQMSSSVVAFGGAVVYGVTGSDFNQTGNAVFLDNNGGAAGINATFPGAGNFSASMTENANHRFGVIATSTTGTLYIDGSSANTGTGTVGWVTNGTLVVGNRFIGGVVGGGTGAAWDGPILDVIVSNADETANVTAIDTWETCQYGS